MQQPVNQSPFNHIPPVVAALAIAIVGIELVFYLGAEGILGGREAVGWRIAAQQSYAFSPQAFQWMLSSGDWPLEHVLRFIGYQFLHGGFTHALFAAVIVLALGKMVGEVFSALALLVVFVLCGVFGAAVYGLVWPDGYLLIGAYPGAYGLIGAFTFLLWVKLRAVGENSARAFTLIGFLMGIQLVFGLLFGDNGSWVAELAGFCFGFALSFVLVPGGWARIRAMLRRD